MIQATQTASNSTADYETPDNIEADYGTADDIEADYETAVRSARNSAADYVAD